MIVSSVPPGNPTGLSNRKIAAWSFADAAEIHGPAGVWFSVKRRGDRQVGLVLLMRRDGRHDLAPATGFAGSSAGAAETSISVRAKLPLSAGAGPLCGSDLSVSASRRRAVIGLLRDAGRQRVRFLGRRRAGLAAASHPAAATSSGPFAVFTSSKSRTDQPALQRRRVFARLSERIRSKPLGTGSCSKAVDLLRSAAELASHSAWCFSLLGGRGFVGVDVAADRGPEAAARR